MSRIKGYIVGHWRGELPLGVSYWLSALAANVVGVAASWPMLYLLTKAQLETAFAWYYVWTWTVTAAVASWALVGVWRSARRRLLAGPSYWAQLAKYVVILNVALLPAAFFATGIPAIREGLKFSRAIKGLTGEVRVLPGGTDIELAGGIGFGFTDKVVRALDANPSVKTIQTNLYKGGLIDEAKKLSAEITRRGLATNVSGACVSACTIVYLGGVKRTLGSQARVGFHRPFVPGGSSLGEFFIGANAAALMTSRGVDEAFAARAMNVDPKELWYPGLGDLVASKFADRVAFSTEGGVAGPPLESDRRQTDEELLKMRLYRALKRSDPDSYARVVELFTLGTATGKSVPELNRELQPVITAAYQSRLPFADDASLAKLARFYVEEFRALDAISPRACWAAAAGAASSVGGDSLAKLPADIQTKNLDMMAGVLETARASRPPDPPRVAERALEKLRANVAARLKVVESGAGSGPGGKEQALTCKKLVLIWEEFSRLPPAQAGAALRAFYRDHQKPLAATRPSSSAD